MAENVNITIRAFDKTKKGFGSATKGLKAVAGAVLSAKTAIVGLVGAAGFGLLISRSLQATDTLSKTAAKIGTTTEALGALRYAADLTGVATQTMDMALQRFTRRTAEAAAGTGEAKGAIKELGINAQELNRMPLDKRMIVLADAFEKVESESDRLRLAFKLFDSEGAALVNTLSQGSDGLKAMLGEAKVLGLTMSGSAAKGVEDTVYSLTKLQSLFKGVTDQTVAAFAPAIEMIVERFTGFLQRSIEVKGGVEAFARSLAIDLLNGVKTALIAFQSLANGFIKVYTSSIKLKNELKDTFNVGLQDSKEYRTDLDKLDDKIEKIKNATGMSVQAQLQATDLLMARRKEILKLYQQAQDAEEAETVKPVDWVSGVIEQIDGAITSLKEFEAVAVELPAVIVPALNDIELGFNSWSDSIPDMTTNIQNLTKQGLDGLTDSLTAGITGAANFADAMKSMAKSVVDSLIKMLIQKYIVDAAFGAITGAISGGQAATNAEFGYGGSLGGSDPFSFAGGGYTGMGSRSGGVDGKGGFPAILHPNETVIDHNTGQSMQGVTVNQTINISTGVQQTVRAEIATLMPQIANAAKGAVADARQRGGGFSKSLVGA